MDVLLRVKIVVRDHVHVLKWRKRFCRRAGLTRQPLYCTQRNSCAEQFDLTLSFRGLLCGFAVLIGGGIEFDDLGALELEDLISIVCFESWQLELKEGDYLI